MFDHCHKNNNAVQMQQKKFNKCLREIILQY